MTIDRDAMWETIVDLQQQVTLLVGRVEGLEDPGACCDFHHPQNLPNCITPRKGCKKPGCEICAYKASDEYNMTPSELKERRNDR